MEQHLRQEEKTVTIFPERSSLFKWLIAYWVIGIVTLLLLIIVFCIYISLFQILPPFSSLIEVTPMYLFLLCAYCLILFFLPPSLWPIIPLTRCWRSPQPLLIFDKHGITIHQQPVLKSVFLPWADIVTLSIMKSPFSVGTSILLTPKDRKHFFVPSRWQRVLHRWLTLGRPHAFFHGPWFLAMPVTELASQIQEVFGKELYEHQIQIQKHFYAQDNALH